MVSESLRSQLCSLHLRWCRNRGRGREGRRDEVLAEGRERGFPVLKLVSTDRTADSKFLFCFVFQQLVESGSPCQAREDRKRYTCHA